VARHRLREWLVRESLASWRQDVRYAARQFRRAPGFVTATIVTLGLGIGATTAIFSVVRGVLLRPLPYPAPDRIVQLWEVDRAGTRMHFSDPNFIDVRDRARSFASLAEFNDPATVSVSGDLEPARATAVWVSHDFFHVFGIQPLLGRTFSPDEEREGGAPAAVLSWGFWQRAFGADPAVLAKRLTIGDHTYTVVGVMRPALDFPAATDIWLSREILERERGRSAHNWNVVGRLRFDVPPDDASREVGALAHALEGQFGSETMMHDAAVLPLRDQLVGAVRPALLVLLAASLALLVIACANVANLVVARITARRGELALRMTLGAARRRLVQQYLAESGMLALCGGALGVLVAIGGTQILLALDPERLPRAGEVRVDALVLLFALGISAATAVGLALTAAWRAGYGDLREMLSAAERTMSGTGSSVRARQTLVGAQVALTLVLLVAAALLAHSFVELRAVDPGFRTDRTAVLDLSIDASDSVSRARRTAFYHELLRRLAGLPGVTAVGAVDLIPLGADGRANGTFVELRSPDERLSLADWPKLTQDRTRAGDAEFRLASGGYFAAMHIPVLEGRVFDERDAPDAPHVAVVSASLAQRQWPGRDPIGRWIQFGNMDGDLRPFMVVGVVGDVRDAGLTVAPRPTFYADHLQRPVQAEHMNFVLAGPGDPAGVGAAALAVARGLGPDVPARVRTMESIVTASVADRRVVLFLVGAFGTIALALAAFGLYSVISYLVAQRSRELGIRIALGADRGAIVRLVLQEGTIVVAVGVVAGITGALLATKLLRGLLYGVSALDPVSFGAVLAVVIAAALAACWLPAYRASRADPAGVLRA